MGDTHLYGICTIAYHLSVYNLPSFLRLCMLICMTACVLCLAFCFFACLSICLYVCPCRDSIFVLESVPLFLYLSANVCHILSAYVSLLCVSTTVRQSVNLASCTYLGCLSSIYSTFFDVAVFDCDTV